MCVKRDISEAFTPRDAGSTLPGIACITDDKLFYRKSDVDHDSNLESFIKKCQQKGIKLNREKSAYKCKEVPFHGHLLTTEGLKADRQKIKTINDMPRPEKLNDMSRLNIKVNPAQPV